MPNYDFGECSSGNEDHVFEKFIPLSEWKDKLRVPCQVGECTGEARQVVLPRGTGTTIEPFVYYLNARGEIRVPSVSDLATPPGHTRCEVTTLHELRRLEHRLSNEERVKISYRREAEDQYDEQMRAVDRADIRQHLATQRVPEIDYEASERTGEIVYTGRTKEMSPATLEFMRMAVQRSNQKRNFYGHDPGLHFGILHDDQGSRKHCRERE